ncbi:unnamed protein product [Rhodiola kirilowii]
MSWAGPEDVFSSTSLATYLDIVFRFTERPSISSLSSNQTLGN